MQPAPDRVIVRWCRRPGPLQPSCARSSVARGRTTRLRCRAPARTLGCPGERPATFHRRAADRRPWRGTRPACSGHRRPDARRRGDPPDRDRGPRRCRGSRGRSPRRCAPRGSSTRICGQRASTSSRHGYPTPRVARGGAASRCSTASRRGSAMSRRSAGRWMPRSTRARRESTSSSSGSPIREMPRPRRAGWPWPTRRRELRRSRRPPARCWGRSSRSPRAWPGPTGAEAGRSGDGVRDGR